MQVGFLADLLAGYFLSFQGGKGWKGWHPLDPWLVSCIGFQVWQKRQRSISDANLNRMPAVPAGLMPPCDANACLTTMREDINTRTNALKDSLEQLRLGAYPLSSQPISLSRLPTSSRYYTGCRSPLIGGNCPGLHIGSQVPLQSMALMAGNLTSKSCMPRVK